MIQIKVEDIDFSNGCLHLQASNAKFKKPCTVVLLPKVAEAVTKQLAGRSKGRYAFRHRAMKLRESFPAMR